VASGIEGGALAERRYEPPRAIPGLAYARRNAVTLLLAGAVLASGALLLGLGSRLSFFLDDWTFLVYRTGFDAEAILDPHNEHIAVGLVLVYKAILAGFGMDSTLPFRVVSTSVFLLSTVLLFLLVRRRVGEWPALLGATLVLFLGAAWEDLLWPFQLGYFASMAAGLGMLLAFERGGRRGDLLACGLLIVSLLFSSVGLPFAVGAAVHLLQHPNRLRRAYVVAVPLGLFALWYLGWGRGAESSITAGNVATAPLYLFDGIASSVSSLLGLAAPRDESAISPLYWGRPLLVLGLLGAAWRLRALEGVPRWLVVFAAITATFWLLAGASEKEGRPATASRYVYLGGIFVLLLAAELLRGWRPSRLAIVGLCALTAFAVIANLSYLHGAYTSYKGTSDLERAGLGAVEIARDHVEFGFLLSEDVVGTAYVSIEAGPYLDAVDRHGSAGYTPGEIAAAPDPVRAAADRVLAAALELPVREPAAETRPAPATDSASPPAPAPAPAPASCRRLESSRVSAAAVQLPIGGAMLRAPPRLLAEPGLRRFGAEPLPLRLEGSRDGVAALRLPPDRADAPWVLELHGAGSVAVCALR